MRTWRAFVAGWAISFGLAASAVRADTVQLVNGDTLSGQVVSLDAKQLELTTKLLGKLTIERVKIRAIFFGDARPASMAGAEEAKQPPDQPSVGAPAAAASSSSSRGSLVEQMKAQGIDPEAFRQALPKDALPQPSSQAKTPGDKSPEDVVRQLRQQGLDESIRSQLQQEFPLLGASGPQQYFNDTISGLMSGKISLQDIRKDAIDARNQLLDLQKDLGPEGAAALSAYMGILDRFIRETEPSQEPPAEKKSP